MTQFSLRQLWRLLAAIVAVAPLALIPAFAFGEIIDVPSGELRLSSANSDDTYKFVDFPSSSSTGPSGPVIIDLTGTNASDKLFIPAAFEVDTVTASIYTDASNGFGETMLTGDSITINGTNELTFGKPIGTDTGTINVYASISGSQKPTLTINRGSSNAKTSLNVANSGFHGNVNIFQGELLINNAKAINDSNEVYIGKNGTLTLNMGSDDSSVTVKKIDNAGTINLNNKTLIITEDWSSLGTVSNGQLQFNSNFTLDNTAELENVNLFLNGTTLTVKDDKALSGIQTTSGDGTVVIKDGKTLTLTDPEAFGTDVIYMSDTNNGGTLAFGSGNGGDFETGTTAQLSTDTGKMVNVQVNKKSSWTLGTNETVNKLILAGDQSKASSVDLDDNTLTVNNGIETSGTANISTGSLDKATNITGSGTLTLNNVNLNNDISLNASKDASSNYTVIFNNVNNHGNITINSNTVLQADSLETSKNIYGFNGGKLEGSLTQKGTGKTYIEGGTFNITGDAKYESGTGIVIQGANSDNPDLLVNGKLIFNTDANVTLSGNRTVVSLKAVKGIYSYGSGSESELTNNLAWKPNNETGTEYIVYDSSSEQQQDYFKILLDSNAYIKDLTYNDRLLNITLKFRPETDNPIEQILVNEANKDKPSSAMTTLYDKVNNDPDHRESALNQLNPYTVSATTANQMWISQEYTSRTFQRMKMVRMAACGYDAFVPMGPGYADMDDNPEVAYLAQSCGYPEYGYDYAYGYGAPCGWRPGYCGVLGNQWWFRGIGAWERQEADGNLARYDTDYSGFTIGVDRLYGPGMLFGMSAGGVWNTTKFKDAGGSVATGGTFLFDLYGSYFNECSHFDYMFGYQGGTTDTTRRTDFGVDPTYGKIKSNTFIAAIELGRTFRFLRNTLEPFYDLQYINIQNDGLRERGSEAELNIYKNNQHALLQTLGIRYMGSCAGPLKGYYFIPQVEVGWVHNYSGSDVISVASFARSIDAERFVTTGYRIPRDRVKVSVGLDIVFNPAVKIDIKYECQAGSGFGFHTLTGGFDWNF